MHTDDITISSGVCCIALRTRPTRTPYSDLLRYSLEALWRCLRRPGGASVARGWRSPFDVLQMGVERRLRRPDRDLLPIGEDGSLDGGAVRHGFLWRDIAVGLTVVEVLTKERSDASHARGAAHQHQLIHIRGLHADLSEHRSHGPQRPLE